MTAATAVAMLQRNKAALYNNVILRLLTVRVILYESIHLFTCELNCFVDSAINESFANDCAISYILRNRVDFGGLSAAAYV